jgi:parvulin-like peptidyl-prolyl isomerase
MNTSTTTQTRFLSAFIIATNAGFLCLPVLAQGGSTPKPAAPKPAPAAKPMPTTGTVAEVNGEKISAADVERQLARIREAQEPLQANTPEVRKALEEIRGNVLESIIDWRLEVQEAKKQRLTPDTAKVDAAVADFRKRFKTETEMKAALTKEGKNVSDLRTLISEGMMVNALEAKWADAVSVTEAEIAAAYRENITQFAAPESVRARHILVAFGVEKPTQADKDKARKKAEDLLKQAKAPGADFGTLAKANSDDTGSKSSGGELGAFPRGTMVQSFEDAAFSGKKGEIVGPVESPFGYHLILVEEKFPARTLPLNEARDMMREPLLQQKREVTVTEKMAALRGNARIKKL